VDGCTHSCLWAHGTFHRFARRRGAETARRHPPCDLVGVRSSSICADGGWGRTVAFSGHFVRARGALVGGWGSARSGAASACAWFRFALRTPPGRPRPISLEATQEGPISNSKKAQHIHFGFQVHIQTPIQLMPEGTPGGHHLDPRVRDGRWEGMEEAISLHSWDSRLAFFLVFAPLPKPRSDRRLRSLLSLVN
jgi:hypothetical protein